MLHPLQLPRHIQAWLRSSPTQSPTLKERAQVLAGLGAFVTLRPTGRSGELSSHGPQEGHRAEVPREEEDACVMSPVH